MEAVLAEAVAAVAAVASVAAVEAVVAVADAVDKFESLRSQNEFGVCRHSEAATALWIKSKPSGS